MSSSANFYYCSQCKDITSSVENLLFVEPGLNRGFCSEDCLLEFYGTLMNYFEKKDLDLRAELNLMDESVYKLRGTESLIEETLEKFDKHTVLKNRINEEYHFFIKRISDSKYSKSSFYVLVISFLLEKKASLVLFHTVTQSSKLVDTLIQGTDITQNDNSGEVTRDANSEKDNAINYMNINLKKEVIEVIDQKKSGLLADLLSKRSPSDIPFEDFHLYEQFGAKTLEDPDELYKYLDEGEEIFIYIKTHSVENKSFYYLIICLYYSTDEENMQDILIPILSFPTLDPKIYSEYKKGEQISGNLKN